MGCGLRSRRWKDSGSPAGARRVAFLVEHAVEQGRDGVRLGVGQRSARQMPRNGRDGIGGRNSGGISRALDQQRGKQLGQQLGLRDAFLFRTEKGVALGGEELGRGTGVAGLLEDLRKIGPGEGLGFAGPAVNAQDTDAAINRRHFIPR